jgi:hypothetical protein
MGKNVKPSDSPEVIGWTVNRKKEVGLRIMRGEPIDALSPGSWASRSTAWRNGTERPSKG